MKIDEEKTEILVKRYREKQSADLLEKIVKEVSPAVYRYPALAFRRSPDDCSDFYLYFVPRLGKLVLKYRPERASFRTWFSLILKSQYLNWLDMGIRKKAKEVAAFSYDARDDVRNKIMARAARAHGLRKDGMEKRVRETIGNLSRIDYLILHLLYFQADDRFLEVLSSYNKKSEEENILKIRSCLGRKKFRIQKSLHDRIRNCRHELFELKRKGSALSEKEKDRIKKESRRLEKLKKRFYGNLENLEISSVARLLDRPVQEIYYRFKKIRQNLQRNLQAYVRGDAP